MKRFLTYLLYGAGLLLLIYYGVSYQGELRVGASRNFDPLPPIIFMAVYSTVFGAYLDLPRFVIMLRRSGKVQFDWLKFLIIGIPALLVCLSGILSFYLKTADLLFLIQWIYFKFNLLGTALAGAACGYTFLNSLSREEVSDYAPARRYPLAKIVTLFITAAVILYISLNGLIHPVKLVSVQTDVSEASNYTIADGESTVPKQINYAFTFENLPYTGAFSEAFTDEKIRVEPKEKLQSLIQSEIFKEKAGSGYSHYDNITELRISYRIGTPDSQGNLAKPDTLSPEILEEIQNSLFDADLVLEVNNKTKRYNLMDYQEN